MLSARAAALMCVAILAVAALPFAAWVYRLTRYHVLPAQAERRRQRARERSVTVYIQARRPKARR